MPEESRTLTAMTKWLLWASTSFVRYDLPQFSRTAIATFSLLTAKLTKMEITPCKLATPAPANDIAVIVSKILADVLVSTAFVGILTAGLFAATE